MMSDRDYDEDDKSTLHYYGEKRVAIPSSDSEDSGADISGVGDLPEPSQYDSVKRQMSIKFRDLMTDMPDDDDEISSRQLSKHKFYSYSFDDNNDDNNEENNEGMHLPLQKLADSEPDGKELDEESIDIDFWRDDFVPPAPSSDLPLPRLPDAPSYDTTVLSETITHENERPNRDVKESIEPESKDVAISRLLEAIPDYVSAFSESSKAKKMTVSRVPQELVVQQMKEREEIEAKMRYTELDKVKKIEGDLLYREHIARQRVQELENESRLRIQREKTKLYSDFVQREYDLEQGFKKAREEIESYLDKKNAVLKEEVGELEQGKDSIGRRFKVDWTLAPQPIEMRIHTMRAAKNKLPKGAYCLMLTQFDRLGGRPLCWSKLGAYGIGPDAPAVTKPFKHYGRYFDRALHVEDSIFALCPPRQSLKPSFVFLIELFQLANRNNPLDKVVAWAALPMINAQFSIVSGKVKLPLFRGEPSPSIEHFKTIEQLIADDLNCWLCNIYIEIRHLPRLESYNGSSKDDVHGELEVEFDFMSKLLNMSSQEKEKKESDNEDDDFTRPAMPKAFTKYQTDKGLFHRKLNKKRQKEFNTKYMERMDSSESGFFHRKRGVGLSDQKDSDCESSDSSDSETDDLKGSLKEKVIYEHDYSRGEEFLLHDYQKGKLMGIETLNNEESRQWAASAIEKGGNIVRRAQADGSRFDSKSIPPALGYKKIGRASNVSSSVDWTTPLVEQRHYDEYSMSLVPDPAQQKKLLPNAIIKTKLKFLYYEVFGDLLPSKFGTFDWYVTSVCFILAFWLRMYVHYIGQYLFLQAVKTPVYAFEVRVYEMVFKYMSSSVPVSVEFGLVTLGPLSVLVAFFILMTIGKLFYKFAGTLPDSVSLFIAAFGVATVLDSILILLIDLMAHNYHCEEVDESCKLDYTSRECECYVGDFMKLWERMVEDESSGITGLILTVIVYTGIFVASALLLYEYLVYVHKDARILDIWRRISGPSEEFFIPHDFEVSYAQLVSTCAKASKWRGSHGQTRRLIVSEYVERDPYDLDYSAVTKHYAIYESDLAGKRTLYRHFLMLPDGAIIEVFDQLSLDFSNQFKPLEKLLNKIGGQDSKKQKEMLIGDIEESRATDLKN